MQDKVVKPVQEKKPYTQPRLTTHGNAQSLTQGVTDCGSGIPIVKIT